MAEIKVGTSGYLYNEWVTYVYPAAVKKADYLRYYSGFFDTVEINASYYKIPNSQDYTHLLTDGSESLTFSFKAYKTLTHEINLNQWEAEASSFLRSLEPIIKANKLEAVLFQFPTKFDYTNENRLYINNLFKFFKDIPLAVEFRKTDWYNDNVIEGLKSRNISLVSVDVPEGSNIQPIDDVVTSPLAYIRFNGRKAEAWWGEDDHARYDHTYSNKEMDTMSLRISLIKPQAQRIIIYFNNHAKGYSFSNAQLFKNMVSNIK